MNKAGGSYVPVLSGQMSTVTWQGCPLWSWGNADAHWWGTAQARPMVRTCQALWGCFFLPAVPPTPWASMWSPELSLQPSQSFSSLEQARPCSATGKVIVPSKWRRLYIQLLLQREKGPGVFSTAELLLIASFCSSALSLFLTTTRCWKYETKLIFLTKYIKILKVYATAQ